MLWEINNATNLLGPMHCDGTCKIKFPIWGITEKSEVPWNGQISMSATNDLENLSRYALQTIFILQITLVNTYLALDIFF